MKRNDDAAGDDRFRVLHVVLNLEAGGLERVVFDLVRTADSARWDHRIACLEYSGRLGDQLRDLNHVYQCSASTKLDMLWPSKLTSVMKDFRPRVVHSHSGVWHKATLAARRLKTPRIIHTDHGRHGSDPWYLRGLDRVAAARTDIVVAVSDPLESYLRARVLPKSVPTCVITNGVDTSRFAHATDANAVRQEFGVPPKAPIIGTVGRLDFIKGYDVALNALAELLRDWQGGVEPVLFFVGDGPEEASLREQALRLGVNNQVRFLGWREDAEKLYGTFDLFTLSSRSEGTSVSLLEAMSSGTCPLVTDVGGNRAVLGRSLSHRLVPPLSVSALAGGWRQVLCDPEAARRDGAAARQRVEQEFSLRRMVERYEELYRGGVPSTHGRLGDTVV